MAKLKTTKTARSVEAFLATIRNPDRHRDSETLLKLMIKVSRSKPSMWGTSIIGFGDYHYKYASGREGDWFAIGFSPRKESLVLYLMSGLGGQGALLRKLGKCKTSKSCLYIRNLNDVDLPTLETLCRNSLVRLRATYPPESPRTS